MKAAFNIQFDKKSLNEFSSTCEATIKNVGNYSRKALVAACEEILAESLAQVPRDTDTLATSAYYAIRRVSGYSKARWEADIGYAGTYDPVNPKTGKPASYYAVTVHEDLTTPHVFGKAKFLEDPVREYAAKKYPRTVFTYINQSLASFGR